jgi:hypothetical protein
VSVATQCEYGLFIDGAHPPPDEDVIAVRKFGLPDFSTEWKSIYVDYSGKLKRAQID